MAADGYVIGAGIEVPGSQLAANLLIVERRSAVGDNCKPGRGIIHILRSTGLQGIVSRETKADVPLRRLQGIDFLLLTGSEEERNA